jgi:Flp pilus assembly protein TadD
MEWIASKMEDAPRATQSVTRAIEVANTEMQAGLQNARSYLHRGAAYALSGKHEGAIRDLDKVVELQPNFAAAYRERGVIYKRVGNDQEARRDFQKADHIAGTQKR